MARFGRTIRSFYPRPQYGPAYEDIDLSGLRSPGARYREIRPPQPRPDPLLEVAYPRAPESYRDDPRYRLLDRWPYLRPTDYEPHEEGWDYDAGPDGAMFDGRALNLFDRQPPQPRERIPTYEDGVRLFEEFERREREAAASRNEGLGEMPSPLEALEEASQLDAAPAQAGPAAVNDVPNEFASIDQTMEPPETIPEEPEYGGLEQIALGLDPTIEPAGPDAWAQMDDGANDLCREEHAFDQQLEGIVSAFHQQEQAFAEPDWGKAALAPECPEPEQLDPLAPVMMPPAPGPA